MNMRSVTVTCPGGLEEVVAAEVVAAGIAVERHGRGAVVGQGSLEALLRACLWSRCASQVLLRIAPLPDGDGDHLYEVASRVDWTDWLRPGQRFSISVSGRTEAIHNAQYAVFRTKDAIVDGFASRGLARPQPDRDAPEMQVHVHLDAREGGFFLNLGGAPLHERGYRRATVTAPLKENVAAAMVAWSGVAAGETPEVVIDPFCGGGTLLVEAALAVADIAPGLLRERWGFAGWHGHDARAWSQLTVEADERRRAGLARRLPRFSGLDADPSAVRAAVANAAAAGVGQLLHVERQPLAQWQRQGRLDGMSGLVITNPPYGERLSDVDTVRYLYRCLGRKLRAQAPGWRACVLGASIEHLDEIRVADFRQQRCFNGAIPVFARVFDVPARPDTPWPVFSLRPEVDVDAEGQPLANRLRKNWKQLQGWVVADNVRAFRLYDADLPEFNVAVDVYGDRIHVQEYAAPSTVDAGKASHRLEVALDAIARVTGKRREALCLKVRTRQKGARQYGRQGEQGELFEVDEYGARLLVNLHDYLDTGLFLDHRPLRRRLQSLCAGKHFLNLFCYTGTATVHAALGGARSTTSVDLNPRYLAWAEANLALNGFSTHQHRLVRADVVAALGKGGDQFDVILLDPPTFSNSKRTPNVLDVQRDHVSLVSQAMRHLAPDGVLLFSNNYRRFTLDDAVATAFDVQDITADTVPPDFARNPKIHRCWELRHRG